MPPPRSPKSRSVHLALALCFTALAALAAEAPPTLPLEAPAALSGAWKFHPGDEAAWADPGLDDSAWPVLVVPGAWGNQGYEDVKVAWYRLRLRLDPAELDDETVLGLSVGDVSTGYELYAGGELVGGVAGPPPEMAYDRHRTFTIPRRALADDGTLLLAFRIWRADAVGPSSGGLREPPRFGRLEQLVRQGARRELPFLILAALFSAVGLYHLALFGLRREQRDYLWYSLFTLMVAGHTFLGSQTRFVLSDDFVLLTKLEYLAVFTLPALSIQFTWTHLGVAVGRLLRLYQLSFPIWAAVGFVAPGLGTDLALTPWWPLWSLPSMLATGGLVARLAWRGHPEARIIAGGMAVLLASFFHDMLLATNVITSVNLGLYGFLVFVCSMGLSLAHRFHRVYRELDLLRADLEQRVAERTRELDGAKVAAEAASRAKSDFLANMSHEIRTPMNAILGLADLLAKLDLSEKARGYVRTLGSSAKSLLRIIDDILDFSKIEAGKLTLENVVFDLREALEDVVGLLEPGARAKGIDLRLDVDAAVPHGLRGDPVRLRQVLLNVVGNAVKFTQEGRVDLRVEGSQPGMIRFEVEDTGIGIEPEALARLFQPFTQADTSSARRFGGTGLGLAISRQVVDLAGGWIEAESQPGRGSTFVFTLPFAVADPPPEAAPPVTEKRPVAGGRILLAEDDNVSRLIAKTQLEALGFAVDEARNGYEVLEALERRDYDVVLMDCQMPELDGYETTRRIRRDEAGRRRVPVIAVTAHAMEGDREKCLAAGMDDYLSKPYREETLAEVLGAWL